MLVNPREKTIHSPTSGRRHLIWWLTARSNDPRRSGAFRGEKWGYSSNRYFSLPKGVTTFQRSDLQRNMVYNVPSASFMKFKFSSFNFPHVFYRKALHFSSSLVGSSPKIFGTENLNPTPPPNLGGGPRILCLKGEASGLKREAMRPWHDLRITWSLPSTVVSLTFPMSFLE